MTWWSPPASAASQTLLRRTRCEAVFYGGDVVMCEGQGREQRERKNVAPTMVAMAAVLAVIKREAKDRNDKRKVKRWK